MPAHDPVGDLLRSVGGDHALLEPAADSIAGEQQKVSGRNGDDAGAQSGQLITHQAATQNGGFDWGNRLAVGAQQQSRNVAHTQPGQGAFETIERGDRHHGAPRLNQRLMAALDQRDHR